LRGNPNGRALVKRRVVFLTRDGCGLCDETFPHVERASRFLPIDLRLVDITTDRELEDEYHLRIPVLLDTSGRVIAEGRLSRWQAYLAVARSAWKR
jgi:thiol-disulfide isomerase/thioredoxin